MLRPHTKYVYVSFSKMVEVQKPEGYVAIDVNEDNVTTVSLDGEVRNYDLSKLRETSQGYFERRWLCRGNIRMMGGF